MRYLIPVLLLLSFLTAQDKVTFISGNSTDGQLIEIAEGHVIFLYKDHEIPLTIPFSILKEVTLEDGTIIFDNNYYDQKQTEDDLLFNDMVELISGLTYIGAVIEISENNVLFKDKESELESLIPMSVIKTLVIDGKKVYPSSKQKHIVSRTLINVGAVMIAGSGLTGLILNNSEFDENDRPEDVREYVKKMNNLHYFLLLTGGTFIMIGNNIENEDVPNSTESF